MRALTLTQPWASLVITGRKHVETRSWTTAHRGPLVIHAAASWSEADREFAAYLMETAVLPYLWCHNGHPDLPLGAALGTVRLADVVRAETVRSSLTREEIDYGDYTPGRWAWLLDAPIEFAEPIPCRGRLGLWLYSGAMPEGTAA